MNKEDLAWAAGFFEGEGHVKAAKRGKNKWFAVEVAQVYREPLDKLVNIFGGKVYGPYGPYSSNKQAYYQYIIYGQPGRDAVALMRPYLFRKGDQVDAALREMKEYNDAKNTFG